MKIAIIDYGLGNLHSVFNAFESLGVNVAICDSAEELDSYDALVLPGVGAFGDAMQQLELTGLGDALIRCVKEGKALLGVCLGLQLLFEESDEFGNHKGLGLIRGKVHKLFDGRHTDNQLRVPQIGWHQIEVSPNGTNWKDSCLNGLTANEYFYFVHSFVVEPSDPSDILSLTRYGEFTFCSAIKRANITAFQFHPEKSGPVGLSLYQSWIESLKGRSPNAQT